MLRDFTDLDILQKFQESLAKSFRDQDDERDQYFGMWAPKFFRDEGQILAQSSSNPNIFAFRSLPSGTHSRIQIPNSSTLQMLPVAAQGIWQSTLTIISADLARCCSSGHIASVSA